MHALSFAKAMTGREVNDTLFSPGSQLREGKIRTRLRSLVFYAATVFPSYYSSGQVLISLSMSCLLTTQSPAVISEALLKYALN